MSDIVKKLQKLEMKGSIRRDILRTEIFGPHNHVFQDTDYKSPCIICGYVLHCRTS